MKRDYTDYLNDIVESCSDIGDFVASMTYEEFTKDKKTINAVIRSLEVVGEATKKLPIELRLEYKNIPWKQMAGMRDKLIHEYFGVDKEMVWQVCIKNIPKILPEIKKVQLK